MKFIRIFHTLVIVAIFFHSSVASAKAYKCTINGKISYQSTPCKNMDKSEEMRIKVNKVSSSQVCLSTCSSEKLICISHLDGAGFNTDGGLNVCSSKDDWCKAKCNKIDKYDIINKKYAYISAKSKYKLKKAYKKIDENAEKRKKQRVYEWHEKRKQEIASCMAKGMVELDALKSRSAAWTREEKLKNSCKKNARSKVYGKY